MKKSRTVIRRRQSESPALRHLPLVDILVDAQAELQELVVQSGLKVLEAMLEEDRVAVCGPRYAHPPERRAARAGHAPSEVVLGGRQGGAAPPARPARRPGGRVAHVPGVRRGRPAEPARRRADTRGRGDAPVWPQPGAAGPGRPHPGHEQECGQSAVRGSDAPARRRADTRGRGDAPVWPQPGAAGPGRPHPGHEQECGQSAVRGSDAGATRRLASHAARGPRPRGACSTASTWDTTASSSHSGSMSRARNTPWVCGKAPPRTRPCVRGC